MNNKYKLANIENFSNIMIASDKGMIQINSISSLDLIFSVFKVSTYDEQIFELMEVSDIRKIL